MIKILFVLNDLKNGGTEAFVMNYYRKLDEKRFYADFMVLSGDELYYADEIKAKGGKVIHISTDNRKNYFKNIYRVEKFLKENDYDIIHVNSCSLKFMAQIAFAARNSSKAKIIGHAHSVGEPQDNLIYKVSSAVLKRIIDSNIDYAMACSTESAEMRFYDKRIQSNMYAMIPNAIDTIKFEFSMENRNKIRRQYDVGEAIVIGIVGRLEKWKNQTFLLDVLKKVNELENTYLLMVGDGDIREELQSKAKMLGVSEHAIFAGLVDNAYEYYSAMDVFCLPSFGEGFPFVLVEAQANGLNCLVSSDTTTETNISGTVQYLDRFNVDLWAEKVISNARCRISEENINKVIETYDIENATRNLEEIYDELSREK